MYQWMAGPESVEDESFDERLARRPRLRACLVAVGAAVASPALGAVTIKLLAPGWVAVSVAQKVMVLGYVGSLAGLLCCCARNARVAYVLSVFGCVLIAVLAILGAMVLALLLRDALTTRTKGLSDESLMLLVLNVAVAPGVFYAARGAAFARALQGLAPDARGELKCFGSALLVATVLDAACLLWGDWHRWDMDRRVSVSASCTATTMLAGAGLYTAAREWGVQPADLRHVLRRGAPALLRAVSTVIRRGAPATDAATEAASITAWVLRACTACAALVVYAAATPFMVSVVYEPLRPRLGGNFAVGAALVCWTLTLVIMERLRAAVVPWVARCRSRRRRATRSTWPATMFEMFDLAPLLGMASTRGRPGTDILGHPDTHDLRAEAMSYGDLKKHLAHSVGADAALIHTLCRVCDLLLQGSETQGGGAMVVVVDKHEFLGGGGNREFDVLDRGALYELLRQIGRNVHGEAFKEALEALRAPSETRRWGAEEAAQLQTVASGAADLKDLWGQPKKGALLVNFDGTVLAGAANLRLSAEGFRVVRADGQPTGSRHTSGLAMAQWMGRSSVAGAVVVRSEAGTLIVMLPAAAAAAGGGARAGADEAGVHVLQGDVEAGGARAGAEAGVHVLQVDTEAGGHRDGVAWAGAEVGVHVREVDAEAGGGPRAGAGAGAHVLRVGAEARELRDGASAPGSSSCGDPPCGTSTSGTSGLPGRGLPSLSADPMTYEGVRTRLFEVARRLPEGPEGARAALGGTFWASLAAVRAIADGSVVLVVMDKNLKEVSLVPLQTQGYAAVLHERVGRVGPSPTRLGAFVGAVQALCKDSELDRVGEEALSKLAASLALSIDGLRPLQGSPADGAIVLSHSGTVLAAGVRLQHQPDRGLLKQRDGTLAGTLHQSVLGVVEHMQSCGSVGAAFVRAESGALHVVLPGEGAEGPEVILVEDDSPPSPRGVAASAASSSDDDIRECERAQVEVFMTFVEELARLRREEGRAEVPSPLQKSRPSPLQKSSVEDNLSLLQRVLSAELAERLCAPNVSAVLAEAGEEHVQALQGIFANALAAVEPRVGRIYSERRRHLRSLRLLVQ